ncbi:E3 ubiquitin-protein ligase RMND5A-like [Musca autumnalis]|uniref:E3 ubiquitin-protein ligase RMND5A-like n=1 Tax=Musca autumnalis TaxID=221902 RepID=UPI003CEEAB79
MPKNWALQDVAVLNIKQSVLKLWSGRDELPIEIDLDPEYRYDHSIFACPILPILRQQTTEDIPPKKLMHKLSNGLKCPYCPVEQNAE